MPHYRYKVSVPITTIYYIYHVDGESGEDAKQKVLSGHVLPCIPKQRPHDWGNGISIERLEEL